VREISRVAGAAFRDAEFLAILKASAYEMDAGSPSDFERFAENGIKSWAKAFVAAKLTT
jgi:hypothetical protein